MREQARRALAGGARRPALGGQADAAAAAAPRARAARDARAVVARTATASSRARTRSPRRSSSSTAGRLPRASSSAGSRATRSPPTSATPRSVEPAPALVDRVLEATEGNPFFLGEVVNLMAQEGTLTRRRRRGRAARGRARGARSSPRPAVRGRQRAARGTRRSRVGSSTYDTLAAGRAISTTTTLLRLHRGGAARARHRGGRARRALPLHARADAGDAARGAVDDPPGAHARRGRRGARAALWRPRADEQRRELARHFAESAALNRAHAARALTTQARCRQAEARSPGPRPRASTSGHALWRRSEGTSTRTRPRYVRGLAEEMHDAGRLSGRQALDACP